MCFSFTLPNRDCILYLTPKLGNRKPSTVCGGKLPEIIIILTQEILIMTKINPQPTWIYSGPLSSFDDQTHNRVTFQVEADSQDHELMTAIFSRLVPHLSRFDRRGNAIIIRLHRNDIKNVLGFLGAYSLEPATREIARSYINFLIPLAELFVQFEKRDAV